MKLLVLALDKFQDYELMTTLVLLKQSQTTSSVDFFNSQNQTSVGQYGYITIEPTVRIEEIDYQKFDGIFIPGGKAATTLRSDVLAQNVIKKFQELNKYIFAICDAPNALFEFGVITDQKYSSYPLESKKYGNNRIDALVSVDQKLITGSSAGATIAFGLKIIEEVQGFAEKEKMKKSFFGIEK